MNISEIMTQDHRDCDEFFFRLESSAQKKDWTRCSGETDRFIESMQKHFAIEEERLFPAFEKATGMTQGPTAIMRQEHIQLRGLLDELQESVIARDRRAVGGVCETLLIMMQQHNLKEENILYPMMDQTLDPEIQLHLERGLAGAA
ncbi:MAG: hemerythrin domain-containing protein [Gammaproteobacteria bacterium]|nr:hemerythrin domain-containing protein [Gammaproteobacteria bacterium]MBU1655889.1 hemerythrin domain-containing protein [Gammaproteobacteria bacterium]MBU1961014.1 hemerythrin domain-containing protein [Gammaproteobacteria bacterium]